MPQRVRDCTAISVVAAVLATVVGLSVTRPEPNIVGSQGYETEREACARLAPKYHAQTEVILPDKTRVDLLNDQYAIEVEWAPKHYEAVGQSIWYSICTHREPAIVLLTTGESDERYVERCRHVCGRAGVTLYVEEAKMK